MQAGVEIFFGKAKNEANCRRRRRLGGVVGKGGLRENTFSEKQSQRFRVLADVDSLDG
jgi:hypothetical protein